MEAEWIIRIILFGMVHWVLAGILLSDLASRGKVFGGRKPPWGVVILFIPCFGSLIYLLFHPQILNPERNRDEDNPKKRGK